MESSSESQATSVITEATEIPLSPDNQSPQIQEVSESSTAEIPPPAPLPSEEVSSTEPEQPSEEGTSRPVLKPQKKKTKRKRREFNKWFYSPVPIIEEEENANSDDEEIDYDNNGTNTTRMHQIGICSSLGTLVMF